MSEHWRRIHHKKEGQFDIYFSWTYEDSPLSDHFPEESEEQIKDMVKKIDRGDLTWFIAKVSAYKCGIELASDIVGCCLYSDPLEFVRDNDYYADMKERVIEQASVKLVELFTYQGE